MVATEEPIERELCAGAVLGLAGDVEGGQFRLDERSCFERLLIAGAGAGRRACGRMARSRSMPESRPDSSPSQAATRARATTVVAPERRSADDQRLGNRALS